MAVYPSKQPGYTPQIGDTMPAPAPAQEGVPAVGDSTSQPAPPQSPATEGTNAVPVPATPPAPEGLPPGTDQPAAAAPVTTEEADAIEGITDIAEANKVIKKLRDENAKRRVENNEISRVFEGASPQEQAAMLDLMHQLRTDPVGAGDRLREMVAKIDEYQLAHAPVEDDPDEGPEYLTAADLEERRAQWDREAKQKAFEQTAVSLGYDQQSAEYGKLLHIAATEFAAEADPITAAHTKITSQLDAYRSAVIEEYIQSVREGRPDTHITGQGAPPAPTPVYPEGVDGDKPLSEMDSTDRWKQARKKADARHAAAHAGAKNNPLVV